MSLVSLVIRTLNESRYLGELLEAVRQQETGPLDEAFADPSAGPEETLLRKERQARLRSALASLPDRDRSLFFRKYYYYQSTAQIAAELGCTERGVEGRLYRIRKRLQKELGGDRYD